MPRLGIEQLSVFSLPPLAYVALAADLGCDCISTGLTGMPFNPHGYPPFSLREDAALRREMKAALRDRGIAISLGEGCLIRPGVAAADLAADLDLFADLGCERINTLSIDPDLSRSLDEIARLAEMVADRGMVSTVELVPMLTIGTLDLALAALEHVSRRDCRLLIDTMHIGRLGITPDQIAAIDPDRIGYVQLCDASATLANADYMDTASNERLVPGEGDLPLAAYVAALPRDTPYSLEVPRRSLAQAGVGPADRLRPAIAAARALLEG